MQVFNDSAAAQTANALHAKAFTVGQNIGFGDGQYQPDTAHGQRLLMHELAHTIQQGRVGPLPRSLEVSRSGDAGEQNANAVVSSLGGGSRTSVSSVAGAAVQCEDQDEVIAPPPAPPSFVVDPFKATADASLPIGDNARLSAHADPSGASMKYASQMIQANAGMGPNGWNLDSKLSLDPRLGASLHADQGGIDGHLNAGNFQLDAGYRDGKPKLEGEYKFPQGRAYAGLPGAGLEYKIGDVDAYAKTDYKGVNIGATGATTLANMPLTGGVDLSQDGVSGNVGVRPNIFGQNVDLSATANVPFNNDPARFGFRAGIKNPFGIPYLDPSITGSADTNGKTEFVPQLGLKGEF